MKKFLASILVSVAACVAVTTCDADQPKLPVVTIGASLGLTGPLAMIGSDEQPAIQIAVEEINQKGLVIGGKQYTLRVDLQDDMTDFAKASLVAHKFDDEGVVAAIANSRSAVTVAMAPFYNKMRIAQITPNGNAHTFTELGYDTTFRPLASDLIQGAMLAQYAKDVGAKTVATLDNGDASGVADTRVFAENAARNGLTILSHDQVSGFDYKAIITKIRAENPDAVLIGGSYDVAAQFISQSKQLGLKTKWMLGGGSCIPALYKLTNQADLSTVYCVNTDPSRNSPSYAGSAFAQFQEKYKARTGDYSGPYAAYAYDSVYLIVEAMKMAGSTDREAIIKALHKIDYMGITGQKQFLPSGELTHPFLTRHTYKDGVLQ